MTRGTHRGEEETIIYRLEHIAYDYTFVRPPRTPLMQVAEAAMRASQRVNTEAAKRSYYRSTEYLFPLYALEDGDCNYVRMLRPEILGLTELRPRKIYNAAIHGRRWYNKAWPEILEHLKSFLSTEYWLNRHQLRALMAVGTPKLIQWLRRAENEEAVEVRRVHVTGGNYQPQYRLWRQL
jgi:hypothetical protein